MMSHPQKLAFVVTGCSKSGTTWLQKILDSHPLVSCMFEIPILPLPPRQRALPLPKVYDGGKDPLAGVFAPEVRRQMILVGRYAKAILDFFEKFQLDQLLNAKSNELSFARQIHEDCYRHLVQFFLSRFSTKPEAKWVGVKTYVDLEKLHSLFPDIRLIHIIRDGRDVCISKRFHNLRKEVFYLGDERSRLLYLSDSFWIGRMAVKVGRRIFRISGRSAYVDPARGDPLFSPLALRSLALEWKRVVTYNRRAMSIFKSHYTEVYYESLLKEPQTQIKRLFDFLEIPISDQQVDTIVENTTFTSLKARASAHAPNSDNFFRKGETGNWKQYFTESDKKVFRQAAGDLLIELGYERDFNW